MAQKVAMEVAMEVAVAGMGSGARDRLVAMTVAACWAYGSVGTAGLAVVVLVWMPGQLPDWFDGGWSCNMKAVRVA